MATETLTSLSTKHPQTIDFKESISGITWQLRPAEERQILALSQRFAIPEIVARVLLGRSIGLEKTENFLNPTIKDSLPDPFHLLDMDKAANRLADAIIKEEKIAIFGDYDVDGATSSALLKRFCQMAGSDALIYIPDRMTEGYGPNSQALLKLKEQGISLVITVDCGTVALEPLETASNAGLDVIVIDHHLGTETLPKAVAIVNPNRLDETSYHRNLAAVGVSFLLAVATNSTLREKSYFDSRPIPNLLSLLDLVALGTVCDVMSLTGINRAFVTQGLKIMANRQNTGLRVLADIAKLDTKPSSYHLGFILGPRINAGGRVGKSDLGARLLSTENADEAYSIACELNHLNAERKAIEQQVLDEATAKVESFPSIGPVILVASEGWHQGVIGIVASRLKEKYNRPTIIIALENGVGKASCRSISGVDLGATVTLAKNNGLLLGGGGHAMAAGFTIEQSKIEALHNFLSEHFAEAVAIYDTNRSLMLDGCLSIAAVTPSLASLLEQAAPFGIGNPAPRFALTNCYVIKTDIVGQDHIRCIIGNQASAGMGGSLKAMAFRVIGTPLGDTLLNAKGKSLHLAGQIHINQWQGNISAEFTIEDCIIIS